MILKQNKFNRWIARVEYGLKSYTRHTIDKSYQNGIALFPATRQFFSSWLNQVVTSGLTIFFMNVIVGVMITYLINMINGLLQEGGMLGISTVASFAISCVIFFIVILKIPELASGLGGGISNNGFQQAVSTVKGVAKGVKGLKSGSGGSMEGK